MYKFEIMLGIIIVFLVLCTYFLINTTINRGMMNDTDFILSFTLLFIILIYTYSLGNKNIRNIFEHYFNYNNQDSTKKFRHKVQGKYNDVIQLFKTSYSEVQNKANNIRKQLKDDYPFIIHKLKNEYSNIMKNFSAYLKHGSEI